MTLTAVFEHWHLGDGNYAAFTVGDEVQLSFELEARSVEVLGDDAVDSIQRVRDAEYVMSGRVIRSYQFDDRSFPVIEAGAFRFYCPSPTAAALPVGARVRVAGQLALDHYQWVEFLNQYRDPPDLFLNLRVVRIQEVAIPDNYVTRSATTLAMPTSLPPDAYSDDMKVDVSVVGERRNVASFSLVDFDALPGGSGPTRPTFSAA